MDDIRAYAELELGENPLWRWGLALLIAAVTFLVLVAIRRVIVRRTEGVHQHPSVKSFLVEPLRAIRVWYLLVVAFYVGESTLRVDDEVDHWVGLVVVVASLVQIGLVFQRLVTVAVQRWVAGQEGPGSATLAAGLRFVARAVIWSIILLLVLSNLGIEVSALVAGLGVGGVAAALAVQSVLGDAFASLGIYFDRPFDIGDFIIVGDDLGTVEQIGLRSTRVRALSGQQIIFPNANLMGSRIHNYRRMQERRVVLSLGTLYGTKAEELEHGVELIRDAIEAVQGVRFDRAHFKGFGASSLDFEAVYWILDRDYNVFMDAQQAVNLGIVRRFEQAGLGFAFPTRTLHIDSVAGPLVRAIEGDPPPRQHPSGASAGSNGG